MSDESLSAQQIADLADSRHPENDVSRGNPPVRLRRSSVADRGARSLRYDRNRYRALAAHDGTFASGKWGRANRPVGRLSIKPELGHDLAL